MPRPGQTSLGPPEEDEEVKEAAAPEAEAETEAGEQAAPGPEAAGAKRRKKKKRKAAAGPEGGTFGAVCIWKLHRNLVSPSPDPSHHMMLVGMIYRVKKVSPQHDFGGQTYFSHPSLRMACLL